MAIINLREFYSWYTWDEFIEVTDEVAAELSADKRYQKTHEQRIRRNMAIYSLDVDDGIESETIVHLTENPEAAYVLKEQHCRLCRALNSLPEIQGRRVEARYLLGMSQKTIARNEGVSEEAVSKAIEKGLKAMKKYLNSFDQGVDFCPQSEAGI